MNEEEILAAKVKTEFKEIHKVNSYYAEKILEKLLEHKKDYRKTLNDFGGNVDRYEFADMSFVNRNLKGLLQVREIAKEHKYTDSEKTYFIYNTAKAALPYRPKHDITKEGKKWLLYMALEVVIADKKQELRKARKRQFLEKQKAAENGGTVIKGEAKKSGISPKGRTQRTKRGGA